MMEHDEVQERRERLGWRLRRGYECLSESDSGLSGHSFGE